MQEKQTNFDATISKIKAAGADAIAYGGYTNEAAPLLKQLRAGGVTAKFLGFDGLYDPAFPAGAGAGAEGAIVTCPCLPADEAGGTFAADFEKEYGEAPGSYGAEGFDAAQVLLDGFKAGKTDPQGPAGLGRRPTTSRACRSTSSSTRPVTSTKDKVVIWAYEVKGGQIEPQQEIKLS